MELCLASMLMLQGFGCGCATADARKCVGLNKYRHESLSWCHQMVTILPLDGPLFGRLGVEYFEQAEVRREWMTVSREPG
jgi:hypothetical protein